MYHFVVSFHALPKFEKLSFPHKKISGLYGKCDALLSRVIQQLMEKRHRKTAFTCEFCFFEGCGSWKALFITPINAQRPMPDTQLFKQFHKAGLKIVRVLMELLIRAAWCMAVINIDLDCFPRAVSLSCRYNRIKLCLVSSQVFVLCTLWVSVTWTHVDNQQESFRQRQTGSCKVAEQMLTSCWNVCYNCELTLHFLFNFADFMYHFISSRSVTHQPFSFSRT